MRRLFASPENRTVLSLSLIHIFSYNSQVKADKAIKDGAFKDEIVPVVIKGKKGDTVFDTDEGQMCIRDRPGLRGSGRSVPSGGRW